MDSQPPLPAESHPPPPPAPPPSEQTSNLSNDRLDFGNGCGGTPSHVESSPPAKRRKTRGPAAWKPGTAPKSAISSLSENESLEEGELEESDWDAASRKSNATPVMKAEDVGEVSQGLEGSQGSSAVSSAVSTAMSSTVSVSSSGGDVMSANELPPRDSITNQAKPTTASDPNNQEFEIIDDLGSEGEGSDLGDDDDVNLDLDDDDDDFSVDEDEIDAMLDGGMESYGKQRDESNSGPDENDPNPPVEKEKVVLRERGNDPFDILPEGWVVVTHNSGMPIYLHKQSRVCTLSRPYFLGPGSARKHDIPVSAIPCLSYQRALDKEVQEAATPAPDYIPSAVNGDNSDDACPGAENDNPLVKIESAEDHKKRNSLNPDELQDYCRNLFEFKTITVKRFKTWKDRRKHNLVLKKASRPSLPSSTKLITCPVPIEGEAAKPNRKKEFVLNPTGKSDVCILHEYVQHAMRVQPRYIFKEIENGQTPYSATVVISDVQYGTGYSTSKKSAKMEAARKTLEILIPEMNKMSDEDKKQNDQDLAFFDEIKIEDPRVSELFMKAGQPSPFQILYECLRRNYGVGDTQVVMDMKTLKHQKSEFSMKVGKHEAKVVCKNKREGKQQAAQAILQLMHPHIHTWGSLLRLYGRGSGIKEKKMEADLPQKQEGDLTQKQECDPAQNQDADLTQKVVISIEWSGWMTVDTTVPYWDVRRDARQDCHLERYIETMAITPDHTSSGAPKAEVVQSPGGGEVVLMSEGGEPQLAGLKSEKDPDRPGPLTPEGRPGTPRGGLVHAAVQTDSPQEICLTVGSITHRATQTEWQANGQFHKATQYPDMSYSSDEEDFKKPPPVAGPVIKLAEGYGTVTHVPRKQVVLVTKPDGEVTTVSLAPKSCEPERYAVVPESETETPSGPSPTGQSPPGAGEETGDRDSPGGEKGDREGERIFDVRSPDSSTSTARASSPLEGASNVYFASGAIRPMDTQPSGDTENSSLYGNDNGNGSENVRFVPRVVEKAKANTASPGPEPPKTTETTTTAMSPTPTGSETSTGGSPARPGSGLLSGPVSGMSSALMSSLSGMSSGLMPNPAAHTHSPHRVSPRKPSYQVSPQGGGYQFSPQMAPYVRPQMYMANPQLAAYQNPRAVAASLGYPGVGLEQMGYGYGNAGMMYQQGLLQNPVGYGQQVQQAQVQQAQVQQAQVQQAQAAQAQAAAYNQPVCYYDPTTGQLVYAPTM